MPNAAIKGTAYCLNYTPELGLCYGTTPHLERKEHPESPFLSTLAAQPQSYSEACRYAPNLTYIGALTPEEHDARPTPLYEHLEPAAVRFGRYGEIMPEDEFLGLLDLCDVFDLIWLESAFAEAVRVKLVQHPCLGAAQIARLEQGHSNDELRREIAEHGALPLYSGGQVVGCCRRGHELDENLSAEVLLENIACKAGGVLALLHLIQNTGIDPSEIDYVIECSEEAAGDMNQRGGGNMAKAIAEIAGCTNASGCDVRGFCAGPVSALLAGAGMVASGIHKTIAVVAGGAIPKLYMNAREHVKKHLPPLENCLGNFGVLLVPDTGELPVLRLDAVGKHSVGDGAAPQAITTALVLAPLQKIGLTLEDVDKYAAELHIPEITLPAGAGNVPESNYKMIAALGVMKGQLERSAMPEFVRRKGMKGFAHTQGHIPSGVPFIGHAVDAIQAGTMHRAMIIGKGSLFLGRLTNLADGASFLIEAPGRAVAAPVASLTVDDVKAVLLDALAELAARLNKA